MADLAIPPTPGRVLLLGARGYLGGYFLSIYPDAAVPSVDIADPVAVRDVLDTVRPDVVINCAGKTGRPNVDWCETHQAETLRSNVTGVLVLLEECLRRRAHLVHMSSGCIYSGDNGGRGYSEDDAPNFAGSFYSRSKAWSDQILRTFPVLTLRLRMPFDGTTHERNLLTKLRKYARVLVEPNSLTYMPEFLRVARSLIARRATGVYNVVNDGVMSPFDIMTRYRDTIDPSHTFAALPGDQLSEVARAGRSNCRLSTAKLRGEGLEMSPVSVAVDRAMGELAERLG